MKSPIDPTITGKFFGHASERFPALLVGLSQFRDRLQAAGENNPYFAWKVSDLATNRRSFELEYLSLKLRAVLTIRPHIDLNGLITFYKLDEFDPTVAIEIDTISFDAEFGGTGIKNTGGAELYINVERHALVLMSSVLHGAYLSEGDACEPP